MSINGRKRNSGMCCSETFCKILKKTPMSEFYISKVTGLQLATLIKEKFRNRCFLMSFAKSSGFLWSFFSFVLTFFAEHVHETVYGWDPGTVVLTHLLPMYPFSTPWKHQKTVRWSRKGALGLGKNEVINLTNRLILYHVGIIEDEIQLKYIHIDR